MRVHSKKETLAYEATDQPLNSCSKHAMWHKPYLVTDKMICMCGQSLLFLNYGECPVTYSKRFYFLYYEILRSNCRCEKIGLFS